MIGIIGGTGLYKMDGLTKTSAKNVQTPYGSPSSELIIGEIAGHNVVFLPRHGESHQILPSEINYRANIWALKSVGVRRVISVSAVGSLREEICPGDLAIPSQYLDWTRGKREGTFFGNGLVAHISTAYPTCEGLANKIAVQADDLGIKIHRDKTYACVEGPRLGTRAESLFLRRSGCDLVGMTNVPEVFLAREAQLCYSTIAVATDYDCWQDDVSQHASLEKVLELYRKNISRIQKLINHLLVNGGMDEDCGCRHSLMHSVMTAEEKLSGEQMEILNFLRI